MDDILKNPAGSPGTTVVRTPSIATSALVLPNTKLRGFEGRSVGKGFGRGICSMTKNTWPWISPSGLRVCGEARYAVCGLVENPVTKLEIAKPTVIGVSGAIMSPFRGYVNLEEGCSNCKHLFCKLLIRLVTIWDEAGKIPIGAGLQKPVAIWVPFVSGRVVVAQKFI